MTPDIFIEGHFDKFNKIVLDFANIDICIDDEYQVILLLSSLDTSYFNLKGTMMYGRESLILDEVQSMLNSRALQNKLKLKTKTGEGLYL